MVEQNPDLGGIVSTYYRYLHISTPDLSSNESTPMIVSPTLRISLIVPDVIPSFESGMKASSRYCSSGDLGFRNKHCYTHNQCEVPEV